MMSHRIGIIVQARMGSSRLPGKVMKIIKGRPLIEVLLKRLSYVKGCDIIIVATTKDPKDDPLVDFCKSIGAIVFRGPEQDVLERYYLAAKSHGLDQIVRITGDCPLADPLIITDMISKFAQLNKLWQADYMNNTREPRYPRGLDAEVFSFKALEKAYHEAKQPYEREHVTPYIWENDRIFKVVSYKGEKDSSQYRLTVDTQEDLDLILAIERELSRKGIDIVHSTLEDVLLVLQERPELTKINAGIVQKSHKEIEKRAFVEKPSPKGHQGRNVPTVLFRTNVSSRIGMGHLLRCTTIAEEMAARGWHVSFIVKGEKDADRYDLLGQVAKDVTVLPPITTRAKDLARIGKAVQELHPAITIVDSYDVNPAYLQSIRKSGTPVAYIDDLAKIKGGMDLLINYNSGFDKTDYKGLKGTKLILGLKYCPLNKLVRERRERMTGPPQQPDIASDMLLTLGGGTHPKILSSILKVLKDEDWIKKVHITAQRPKGHTDERFEFLGFHKDLPSIIIKHPLAISAGGSTSYQLASLGVPAIIVILAPNQVKAMKGLHELGTCINMGKATDFKPKIFKRILTDLAYDKKARQKMAQKAFKTLDHLGAKRMVDRIEEEYL